MADLPNMVPPQPVPQNSGPSATDPTTAAAAVSTNTNAAEVGSDTQFSSLSDMRTKNPKLYNFMMQSLGMNICTEMKRQSDHLQETLRKMREND
jgi:hypothetical protein